MSETLANMEKLGSIDYSTDEQWTGRRWIDGKKIFQKTIELSWSTMTQGTTSNRYVAHNISMDIPIKVDTVVYKSNNAWITGSPGGSSTIDYSVGGHFDTTNLYISCGNTMVSRLSDIKATIQYTKPTT